jgi:hypothetical protein
MIEIVKEFGSSILRLLVLILWGHNFLKYGITYYNKITFNSIKLFIILMTIHLVWNISMYMMRLLQFNTSYIYIVFWSAVNIFEFFYICTILFLLIAKEKSRIIFILVFAILSLQTLIAALFSFLRRSYDPLNASDFFNIIILLLGTIIILRRLLQEEKFVDNIESFFIFSGFVLYFCLHILATNIMSLNFLGNWSFGQYATIVSLLYWLGSLFFIWKIRSKRLF